MYVSRKALEDFKNKTKKNCVVFISFNEIKKKFLKWVKIYY